MAMLNDQMVLLIELWAKGIDAVRTKYFTYYIVHCILRSRILNIIHDQNRDQHKGKEKRIELWERGEQGPSEELS